MWFLIHDHVTLQLLKSSIMFHSLCIGLIAHTNVAMNAIETMRSELRRTAKPKENGNAAFVQQETSWMHKFVC